MSPTGVPLIIILLAASVALPIIAIIACTRIGPRLLAVIVCVVMVLASQFAAIGLAAAAVNRAGDFYTTWSQVRQSFSTTSAPGLATVHTTAKQGADPQTAGSLTTHPDATFSTRAQWATKGRVESVTITGPNSGLTSHAFVYLPPEYFQPADQHTRFPASEVLTGYPGNDRNLVQVLKYPAVLRAQVAAGQAKPMALVMLRPPMNYRRDTECTDVPGGPQALTFFAQDVPTVMSHHLRVQPSGWGAIGDSTGGYCATKLAMLHPATFHAAVSLSGYYTALQDKTTGDLWGGSQVIRDLNDLSWRLQHQPAPATSLLVTISQQESGPLGYANTQRFMSLAKPPLALDSIVTPTGGHNFTNWSRLLPRSVAWLSAKLPAPEVIR